LEPKNLSLVELESNSALVCIPFLQSIAKVFEEAKDGALYNPIEVGGVSYSEGPATILNQGLGESEYLPTIEVGVSQLLDVALETQDAPSWHRALDCQI
jgi:hypothetical protein